MRTYLPKAPIPKAPRPPKPPDPLKGEEGRGGGMLFGVG